jgi:hypothetical protein
VAILFPFQSIKSSTPSDSALAKSHIITSAESALPKSKDFKGDYAVHTDMAKMSLP